MGYQETILGSPKLWLRTERPDEPIFFFCPATLRATLQDFRAGFPGQVTYAVKSNPHHEVLSVLAQQGVTAFDVASPDEMMRVRQVLPNAQLHYHNPVRSRDEIALARLYGITSWSIDRMSELDKLGPLDGAEIAVRFKLSVEGAAYDFGSKFGAVPKDAAALLQAVVARGGLPSLTFHPGTQCHDAQAWVSYIRSAAEIARAAGTALARLNVGGGFPAHRCDLRPDLQGIFAAISTAVEQSFDGPVPALVCEPGRGMVSEAFTLALRVKATNDEAVFLNDGIYGALNEWRDLGAGARIDVLSDTPEGAAGDAVSRHPRIVFGPTCDSLDRLPEPILLPKNIAEDDYVLFPGTGAYSLAQATRFNGYGTTKVVTLRG